MRPNDPQYARRVSHAIALLQGRWKIKILCAMRRAPLSLTQLKRLLPLASEKALADSLAALLSDGIIVRRTANHTALEGEYDFSELLKESLPALLDHLDYWDEFYAVVRSTAGERQVPALHARRSGFVMSGPDKPLRRPN